MTSPPDAAGGAAARSAPSAPCTSIGSSPSHNQFKRRGQSAQTQGPHTSPHEDEVGQSGDPASSRGRRAPSRRRRSAEGPLARQCALTGAGPVPRCRRPPAERRRIGVVEAAATAPYRDGLIASRSAWPNRPAIPLDRPTAGRRSAAAPCTQDQSERRRAGSRRRCPPPRSLTVPTLRSTGQQLFRSASIFAWRLVVAGARLPHPPHRYRPKDPKSHPPLGCEGALTIPKAWRPRSESTSGES